MGFNSLDTYGYATAYHTALATGRRITMSVLEVIIERVRTLELFAHPFERRHLPTFGQFPCEYHIIPTRITRRCIKFEGKKTFSVRGT
jgi:hypothetical protein